MNIGILGAGSLGTVIGAKTAVNGGDCLLIDANEEHVKALNEKGATITGYCDLRNVPVRAITPQNLKEPLDMVFVLIKQTANHRALTGLLPYLKDDSIVCTLQNGVPEYSVGAIVGMGRTVGGAVGFGGIWRGAGLAELVSEQSEMRIEIGSPDGGKDEMLEKVKSFLSYSVEVDISRNFMGVRWSKLLMNCALSGMSAALGVTFGEVIDDDRAIVCAAKVADELIRVADARGIGLAVIVPGVDFYRLRISEEHGVGPSVLLLREIYEKHRPTKASMLLDMEKNIPCEIDFINGLISDTGKKYNIATPFNDKIIETVKNFESGSGPFPTMRNLSVFEDLLKDESYCSDLI